MTQLDIGGAGEYRTIIKFNAQVGRWVLRGSDEENEIEKPTMVMDLANIATGWVLFLEGSAPKAELFSTDKIEEAVEKAFDRQPSFIHAVIRKAVVGIGGDIAVFD